MAGVARVEPEPVVFLGRPVQVHLDQFVRLVAFDASPLVLSGFCKSFPQLSENIQTKREKIKQKSVIEDFESQ